MPPILYIKNTLRLAENGLGDGTVYAFATGATPNQAQRTFVLSGLSLIAYIGADADDKFNSYILYFPASGNKYHIVDWVATTDTATVWETPTTTDAGACEIRRALVDNKALAANPVKHLSDGQKYALWKSAASATLDIHLPNFVDHGGFENGDLTGWSKVASGGTADTTGVNATSPILGVYDLRLDLGDRAFVFVRQPIKYDLVKGRSYRLIFKARNVGTFTAGDLGIKFNNRAANLDLNVTFSNLSSGTATSTIWSPGITASNTWHSVDLTPTDQDIPAGSYLWIEIFSNTPDVYMDEIYLFEQVNVSSLVLFDPGVNTGISALRGRRCASDRTGYTVAVEDQTFSLPSLTLPDGPVSLSDFTGGIFPIYSLVATTLTEASEILLCEKWAWEKGPNKPFGLDTENKKQSKLTTRSGINYKVIHYKKRNFRNTFPLMSEIDRLKLMNNFKPHHWNENHPFGVLIKAGDKLLLMEDQSENFITTYNKIKPDWSFDFIEVV